MNVPMSFPFLWFAFCMLPMESKTTTIIIIMINNNKHNILSYCIPVKIGGSGWWYFMKQIGQIKCCLNGMCAEAFDRLWFLNMWYPSGLKIDGKRIPLPYNQCMVHSSHEQWVGPTHTLFMSEGCTIHWL